MRRLLVIAAALCIFLAVPAFAQSNRATISGTVTQGQTLTAVSTLADMDGLGVIAYQWSANGTSIDGGIRIRRLNCLS